MRGISREWGIPNGGGACRAPYSVRGKALARRGIRICKILNLSFQPRPFARQGTSSICECNPVSDPRLSVLNSP